MNKPFPSHPVRLAPGRSIRFHLGLSCGAPDAPPPPWRVLRGVGEAGAGEPQRRRMVSLQPS